MALGWYTSLDLADLKRPRPGERQPADHAARPRGRRVRELRQPLRRLSDARADVALAAQGGDRDRGPALLPASGHRPDRHPARARAEPEGRPRGPGRQHDQPAARQARVPDARAQPRRASSRKRFTRSGSRRASPSTRSSRPTSTGSTSAAAPMASMPRRRRYFAKPASELSLAEAALLAGVIRAPSHYAPTRDLALARQRAAVVLDAMVEAGIASAEQAAAAKARPATLASAADARRYRLLRRLGGGREPALRRGRRAAPRGRDDPRPARAGRRPRRRSRSAFARAGTTVEQAALVAMTPERRGARDAGRPLLRGRASSTARPRPSASPARRSSCSSTSPRSRTGLRPEDLISAAPLEVDGWQPRNDDDDYPRSITLIDAFALSVNTAAVRLAEQVGRGGGDPHRRAARHHLGTARRPEPGARQLGGAPARADRRLRLDRQRRPSGVAGGDRPRSRAAGDKVLYRRRAVDEPVLEPSTVRAMRAMLEIALRRGTGRQAALRRFVAGKTGTSSENRDACSSASPTSWWSASGSATTTAGRCPA